MNRQEEYTRRQREKCSRLDVKKLLEYTQMGQSDGHGGIRSIIIILLNNNCTPQITSTGLVSAPKSPMKRV